MRHVVVRVLAGVVIALAVVTHAPPLPAEAVATLPLSSGLVDGERAAHGRTPLRVCADLRDTARRWSAHMAREGRLAHDPGLATQVRGWRYLGDNVGRGTSVADVHNRLLASNAHRATMLRAGTQEIGVGIARRDGQVWVTQIYREPDGSAPCRQVRPDDALMRACHFEEVPPTAFTDVGGVHRHATDCVGWYGVGRGRTATRFAPASAVTRGQLATFLLRTLARGGTSLPAAGHQGFVDLAGSPHAEAVNRLTAAGILEGATPTTFEPRAVVTRAQAAAMLVRSYEHVAPGGLPDGGYSFADGTDSVHREEIGKAAAAGIVNGRSSSTFAPDRPVRRDQVASFLARMLDRLVTAGHASHARG